MKMEEEEDPSVSMGDAGSVRETAGEGGAGGSFLSFMNKGEMTTKLRKK